MAQIAIKFDKAGCEMVDFQEHDQEYGRYFYLLRGNPAARIVVRGGQIGDCESYTLPAVAGFEECWGQWPDNAPLRGRKTYIVTVFCGEVLKATGAALFSEWLARHYLAADALYREAGGRYQTPIHPRKKNGYTL